MSPRRYNFDRRQAATEATRQRIIEATVALHAEQGVLATSYAQIARRADVAVPTVYKHFPDQGPLLRACTGHVFAQAPMLGPGLFEGIATAGERLVVLTKAVFALHRYLAPWMRWGIHEQAGIPELAKILAEAAQGLRGLIRLALEPRFGGHPPAGLPALTEILLDFTAWRRLTQDHGFSQAAAEEHCQTALLALLHAEKTPAKRKLGPRNSRLETRQA
jgi:AcrR family transcriptional regulator